MSVRIEPINGLLFVDAASTASLTLSGLQTVDGVSLTAGKLCLAKDQASIQAVYMVQSTAWVPVDPGLGFGLQVCVRAGTANAGAIFRCTTSDPIVWGTTATTFVTSSGSGGAFNPLVPGNIGGTTPGIVNATDLYLAMSTGSPVPGRLQLASTASTASLVIIAGGGSNTSIGQDPSTNTARAAIRTLSITLADNGTYDFNLTSSSGGSAVIASTNGSIVATVGFNGSGTTTTGGQTYDNFSATLTTPAKLNVGASGGALRFENKTGGPLSIVATITLFIAA